MNVRDLKCQEEALLLCVILLLLGLLAARLLRRSLLGLMNDEACPGLILVPLETSEVGLFHFVIGLVGRVLVISRQKTIRL